MKLRAIQVPYDSGHRDRRMGNGPGALIDAGLLDRLTANSCIIERRTVVDEGPFSAENMTTAKLWRGVAREVAAGRDDGAFPLLLAGNCSMTLGGLAGCASGSVGLVWFDAHGDFHTPETSGSGFLDGMAISVIVGDCWKPLALGVPGFRPLAPGRVLLLAARDLDDAERTRLAASELFERSCEQLQGDLDAGLAPVCEAWAGSVDSLWIHLDVDVLDRSLAPVNSYQPPGGLTPDELIACIERLASGRTIVGLSVTAYDPDSDRQGCGRAVLLDVIPRIVALASGAAA